MTRATQHLFILLALAGSLSSCAYQCASPQNAAPPAHKDKGLSLEVDQHRRLILVGDTGQPGDPAERVKSALHKESDIDLVVGLGDLVYPVGPECVEGRITADIAGELDEKIGSYYAGLGAPAALVLGNHDLGGSEVDPAREACIFDYAGQRDHLYLPSHEYYLDLGDLRLIVINTNNLNPENGAQVSRWANKAPGRVVLAGHHVLRTHGDKEEENVVLPWLEAHKIRPDLYVNGHAHFLQFGVYQYDRSYAPSGIPALTSGSGAKLRAEGRTCPGECGEGELWGESVHGYATLDVFPDHLLVQFKDTEGKILWSWKSTDPLPPRSNGPEPDALPSETGESP